MSCTLQLSGTLQNDRVSYPYVAWPVIVLLCLSAVLTGCSSLERSARPMPELLQLRRDECDAAGRGHARAHRPGGRPREGTI